jgi:hypothetical protein
MPTAAVDLLTDKRNKNGTAEAGIDPRINTPANRVLGRAKVFPPKIPTGDIGRFTLDIESLEIVAGGVPGRSL